MDRSGLDSSAVSVLLLTMCAKSLQSCRLLEIPWTVARQVPLSMGFSRPEYWKRYPCPPPEGLPEPRIEPASLKSPALASEFFITSATSLTIQGGVLNYKGASPSLLCLFRARTLLICACVCWSCCNKIPQTRTSQQTCMVSWLWRLEVSGQDIGRIGFI